MQLTTQPPVHKSLCWQEIIQAVTNRLAATPRPCINLYGVFVKSDTENHWIPREKAIFKVREQFEKSASDNIR